MVNIDAFLTATALAALNVAVITILWEALKYPWELLSFLGWKEWPMPTKIVSISVLVITLSLILKATILLIRLIQGG